jgi:hypothetical protein
VSHAAVPAELTPLEASTARLIHSGAAALELGSTWAEDTARVVLAQPAVRDGLAAASVLAQVADRHRPVRWATDSNTEVCPTCHVGAPCDEAVLLGIAPPPHAETKETDR